MPERTYIAIDLKSFYASAECIDRGLDPMTTNLVVADKSRTEKTICLAVSPSLKAYGIPGRARLFQVMQKVREVNARRRQAAPGQKLIGSSCQEPELQQDPSLEVDYITAPPRMAKYMEISGKIYQIYLKYIAPEDIHVYSIDEVFMDVTDYLETYKTNAGEYKLTLSLLSGDARTTAINQGLPTCQNITASCLGNKAQLKFLNGESLKNEIGAKIGSENYSELGSILNIYTGTLSTKEDVKNMLGYSIPMQSVVTYSKRMEERANQEDSEDLTPSEQINDDIYVGAQYNNNQVGDFLEHVEMEQTYKEALDDLQNEAEEMKTELIENLKNYGFEPSSDFDISKEQDYELAVNKLKSLKNQYITQAKTQIDDIKPGEYDVLKDYQNSYNRIYQGLSMDTEAVMTMTMDVDDLSEFSENLKTATVNNTVDETYENEGDEDFENTLKSMKPAYCAGY